MRFWKKSKDENPTQSEGEPVNEEMEAQEPKPPEESSASPAEASVGNDEGGDGLKSNIIEALRTVYDPEIPVNIYDLGLIYNVEIKDNGFVRVLMTLTSPNCPEAAAMPGRTEYVVSQVPGVSEASVELVWEPPWTMEKMSDAAKLQLNMM